MHRESHSRHAGSYSRKRKKNDQLPHQQRAAPAQCGLGGLWTPVRAGASLRWRLRLVGLSALNCVLADRQNLVQAVNGRAAALHEEQWIAMELRYEAMEEEEKPSSAFATRLWISGWAFLHLLPRTGGVSMRRCGVDAMRTSSECDVRGPEPERSERPGLHSFWMICRAATEVDRDYVLFLRGLGLWTSSFVRRTVQRFNQPWPSASCETVLC
ncbi:hypothetical protein HDV63DRAFT_63085 [Trichoderma sp. SZMC 28014]